MKISQQIKVEKTNRKLTKSCQIKKLNNKESTGKAQKEKKKGQAFEACPFPP